MKPLESDPSSNESGAGRIGPGDRLQAARIELSLSVDDIANRMHLSAAILESIEENDFEDITPIFVKGYLRSYARLVSLDEEEVIRQYAEFYSGEDPPISSISNTSTEISSDDVRIKWATVTVIAVLGGLLAAWWWNQNQSQNQNDALSLAVEQSDAVQVAEPVNDSSPMIEPEITASSEAANVVPEVSNEELEETVKAREVEQQVEVEKVEPESSDVIQAESEAMVREEAPAEASQTTVAGPDKLEVIVHADTWTDIKDVNGQRLVYDLLRADRQLKLAGVAPFTVFFGNGHGVEVIFNGQEVDIAGQTRDDNTVRLKIGSN